MQVCGLLCRLIRRLVACHTNVRWDPTELDILAGFLEFIEQFYCLNEDILSGRALWFLQSLKHCLVIGKDDATTGATGMRLYIPHNLQSEYEALEFYSIHCRGARCAYVLQSFCSNAVFGS